MRSTAWPVVSVIVPTHNAAVFLRQTLESVQAQTYPSIEMIIIDDASSDDTVQCAKRWAPKALVRSQARTGASGARNAGLALATGDFVTFLDQDDLWHPMQIDRQVRWLTAHEEAAAVATPYWHWYPEPDGRWPAPELPPDPGLFAADGFDGWTYHHFLLDCWALTSATLLRTAVLKACGAFDANRPYAEDWDLWLRLSRQFPFHQLTWPPVAYRQHVQQGSRIARAVDYRCELLLDAVRKYGLCSPDGRCLEATEFKSRIARYRMEFGYQHMMHGQRGIAMRSLFDAWRRRPGQWRWLLLAAAATAGWRPRPGAGSR